MSKYTSYNTDFEYVGGITYRVKKDITWQVGSLTGPKFIVPAGFIFDVSVPKFARWIFNPHDKQYFKAAAIHDYMLVNDWSRLTAGAEFNSALKADKVVVWRRFVMWLTVSLWKYE